MKNTVVHTGIPTHTFDVMYNREVLGSNLVLDNNF